MQPKTCTSTQLLVCSVICDLLCEATQRAMKPASIVKYEIQSSITQSLNSALSASQIREFAVGLLSPCLCPIPALEGLSHPISSRDLIISPEAYSRFRPHTLSAAGASLSISASAVSSVFQALHSSCVHICLPPRDTPACILST